MAQWSEMEATAPVRHCMQESAIGEATSVS
jgi:hypothetical protein